MQTGVEMDNQVRFIYGEKDNQQETKYESIEIK